MEPYISSRHPRIVLVLILAGGVALGASLSCTRVSGGNSVAEPGDDAEHEAAFASPDGLIPPGERVVGPALDRVRRRAWRPVLASEPINTSRCVVLDMAALPSDLELLGGGPVPRVGYLLIDDPPLQVRLVPTRPDALGDASIGIWWGRSILSWEPFWDEQLDEFSAAEDPELEALLSESGERIPDNENKVGGWPFIDVSDDGYWLQLSAGSFVSPSSDDVPLLPPHPMGAEHTSFGAGWAFVSMPSQDGAPTIIAESHW